MTLDRRPYGWPVALPFDQSEAMTLALFVRLVWNNMYWVYGSALTQYTKPRVEAWAKWMNRNAALRKPHGFTKLVKDSDRHA